MRSGGLVVVAVLLLAATAAGQPSLTAEEEALLAFQALEGSSLAAASYEAELLRWQAIAELVSGDVAPTRLTALEDLLFGLQQLAGVWDRNPGSAAELALSQDQMSTASSLQFQGSDQQRALWAAILDRSVAHAVEDALRLFAQRQSTAEGIATLDIGIAIAGISTGTADSRLALFRDAEQARLDRANAEAAALDDRAEDLLETAKESGIWAPARMHQAIDLKQRAAVILERQGAEADVARLHTSVITVETDLGSAWGTWMGTATAASAGVFLAWAFVLSRYHAWFRQFTYVRQASFLQGGPL